MARTEINTYLTASTAGELPPTPVAGDPVNGNMYSNSDRTILRCENSDAAAQDLTFDFPESKNVDGVELPSKVISLAPGEVRYFKMPPGDYGYTVAFDPAVDTLLFYLIRS